MTYRKLLMLLQTLNETELDRDVKVYNCETGRVTEVENAISGADCVEDDWADEQGVSKFDTLLIIR